MMVKLLPEFPCKELLKMADFVLHCNIVEYLSCAENVDITKGSQTETVKKR